MAAVSPSPIRWRLALVALAATLVYSNSLSNPFIFDDVGTVTNNPTIRNLRDVRAVWSPPFESPVAGRPLVNLSFAVNYAVGGLDVRGYHVVNIALHAMCALLLFGLVRRTLELPGIPPGLSRRSATVAFATALLWAVHPLNSEAVDYITERTESMMALCYLLALYASVRAARSPRPIAWTIVAVLTSAAGMACKESMVTLPVMVMLYDRVFLFESFRQAVAARWPLYAGLVATWVPLAVLMSGHPRSVSSGFASSNPSSWTYLMNQMEMVSGYFRLAVWPDSLVLYYGWARRLTLADVWPHALSLAIVAGAAAVLFVRNPRLGFPAAWVFVTLAPASSFVPVGAEVGAERRMYLPLAGVIVAAVVVVSMALDRAGRSDARRARPWSIAAALVLVICSAALATVTVLRNREYSSPLGMARTVLDRWPTPAAHAMIGTELAKAGQHQEAAEHLRKAAVAYPPAHYSLGLELLNLGNANEAIDHLQAFLQAEPGSAQERSARINLGHAFQRLGRWTEVAEQARLALTANPTDPDAHRLLAASLAAQRAFADALPHYRAYLDAHPDDGENWHGLGIALVGSADTEGAVAAFERAVRLEPGNGPFRTNYARALLAQGDVEKGTAQAQDALKLAPDHPPAHELVGRILEFQGKLAEARREYERALQLDPTDPVALEDLKRMSRQIR